MDFYNEYKRFYAIRERRKKEIKTICPTIQDKSGIYRFERVDEDGFRYAYVGLATTSVLTRCADHLGGYDTHIDKSLKKHGLYSESNPYGWRLNILCYCDKAQCNELEQRFIKATHKEGWQLLNVTGGSQAKGKKNLDVGKTPRGYYDGKQQGQADIIKELQRLMKYVDVAPKGGKLSERMYQKFIATIYPKGIDNGKE